MTDQNESQLPMPGDAGHLIADATATAMDALTATAATLPSLPGIAIPPKPQATGQAAPAGPSLEDIQNLLHQAYMSGVAVPNPIQSVGVSGGMGGALSIVILFAAKKVGLEMDTETAIALATLITGGIGWLLHRKLFAVK